jgi:hypothetical protein
MGLTGANSRSDHRRRPTTARTATQFGESVRSGEELVAVRLVLPQDGVFHPCSQDFVCVAISRIIRRASASRMVSARTSAGAVSPLGGR